MLPLKNIYETMRGLKILPEEQFGHNIKALTML